MIEGDKNNDGKLDLDGKQPLENLSAHQMQNLKKEKNI